MDNILHNSFIFSNFTKADRVDLQPIRQGYPDSPSVFDNIYRGNILIRDNMKRLSFEELPEVNSERWLSLEDLEGEVWKDIEGYEGRYKISCYGRVKRLHHAFPHLGGFRHVKDVICKTHKSSTTGYYMYSFNLDRNAKRKTIHRLVAMAFIPNVNNLPLVNHKDENRGNNHVDNLEWCTAKYNQEYSHVHERAMSQYKKVRQYDKDGNLVSEYANTGDAAKAIGVGITSIRAAVVGKIGSVKGFIWRYVGEENIKAKKPRHRRVVQMTLDGTELKTWNSIKEAARAINRGDSIILNCCKGKKPTAGGYKWKYKDDYGSNKGTTY